MNGTLKIHVWMGTTHKSEEEYLKYFELYYSTEGDFDDPEYKLCEFCKDIDKVWYNEDFIGIIPLFEKQISIPELLEQIPLSPQDADKVILRCHELGISDGNAEFYYVDFDSEFDIQEPYRESYNGLKYIGAFNSSL